MTSIDAQSGSFELLETQLHAPDENKKGQIFEKLYCQFLTHAPAYRDEIKQTGCGTTGVRGRWGPDAGIDVIAETNRGELWAIWAQAFRSDRSISKRESHSFLSEANRSEIAFRLLISTTDHVSRCGRQVLHSQQKLVGVVLRGDLTKAELHWPDKRPRKRGSRSASPACRTRRRIRDIFARVLAHPA